MKRYRIRRNEPKDSQQPTTITIEEWIAQKKAKREARKKEMEQRLAVLRAKFDAVAHGEEPEPEPIIYEESQRMKKLRELVADPEKMKEHVAYIHAIWEKKRAEYRAKKQQQQVPPKQQREVRLVEFDYDPDKIFEEHYETRRKEREALVKRIDAILAGRTDEVDRIVSVDAAEIIRIADKYRGMGSGDVQLTISKGKILKDVWEPKPPEVNNDLWGFDISKAVRLFKLCMEIAGKVSDEHEALLKKAVFEDWSDERFIQEVKQDVDKRPE